MGNTTSIDRKMNGNSLLKCFAILVLSNLARSEGSQKCDPTWTKFYNRDRPSGTGDWETLTSLRAENPGQICANPIAVEARLADGRPAAASGNKITISPLGGLVCQNCFQPK